MGVKIIFLFGFGCLAMGANYGLSVGLACLAITIAIALGLLNLYHLHKDGVIPQTLKILTTLTLLLIVVVFTLAGFIYDIVSGFMVFTIIMFFIFISIFAISTLISFNKINNQFNHPHVYSTYGEPIYRFET